MNQSFGDHELERMGMMPWTQEILGIPVKYMTSRTLVQGHRYLRTMHSLDVIRIRMRAGLILDLIPAWALTLVLDLIFVRALPLIHALILILDVILVPTLALIFVPVYTLIVILDMILVPTLALILVPIHAFTLRLSLRLWLETILRETIGHLIVILERHFMVIRETVQPVYTSTRGDLFCE